MGAGESLASALEPSAAMVVEEVVRDSLALPAPPLTVLSLQLPLLLRLALGG